MEGSFYISARFEISQTVLLLSSVPFEYIKKIPVIKFRKFIDGVLDDKKEDYAFKIWLSVYPNMTQETFIPFDEFYKKKTKEKSIEEAKKDVEKAKQAFEEVVDGTV